MLSGVRFSRGLVLAGFLGPSARLCLFDPSQAGARPKTHDRSKGTPAALGGAAATSGSRGRKGERRAIENDSVGAAIRGIRGGRAGTVWGMTTGYTALRGSMRTDTRT